MGNVSKLAAALAALVAAVAGGWVANIPESIQGPAAVAVAAVAAGLFPALSAQFDEAKGQLVAVLGLVVAAVLDVVILKLGLDENVQLALLAIINGAASLFVPGVHLQQATRFRPDLRDTRPSSKAANPSEGRAG